MSHPLVIPPNNVVPNRYFNLKSPDVRHGGETARPISSTSTSIRAVTASGRTVFIPKRK